MRDLGEGGRQRSPPEGWGDRGGSATGPHLNDDDGSTAGRNTSAAACVADGAGADSWVEDVRMDLVDGLHDPVHGTTVDAASNESCHQDALMHTEASLEVGGNTADFNGVPGGRNIGDCLRNNEDRGNDWLGSAFGSFYMGPDDRICSMDTECPQGARPFAQPNNNSLGVLGGVPSVAARVASPSSSVWARPIVVSLPGRQELGDATVCDGRVQLDEEEVHSTVKRFDMALVGRLFGKRHSFEYLNAELHRRWNGFGPFRLVTVSGDCFVCFFDTVEGRDAVLMGGPWIVAEQVVGVDR